LREIFVKNQADEKEQLEKVLSKLLKDGVASSDIIILSPNRFEVSAASKIADQTSFKVRDIRDVKQIVPELCIAFSTIHAFKGMESPTVVLCGVSDISDEEKRSLLYVGMSRARSHLILMLGEKTKTLLPSLVSRRLSEKWKQ
jgi:ATP-dependent exoDNAse (exonuclease V) beta subunit